MQGRGKGGKKKAATNALLEIDSRRQQYTSNMLYVRENTVINYYSILIIVVGRKLHNEKNHAIIELVSTLAITSLTLTVPPTPQSHTNLYTHTHTLSTTIRILNQQKMAGNARTIDADEAAYCLAAYRSWLFATTQEQMRHLDQSVTTKTTTTTTTTTSKTKISDGQVSSAPGGVVVVMVQSSPSSSSPSSSSSLSTRSLAYNNSSSSSSEILPISAANAILEQDTATTPPPTITPTTTAGQNHLFPAR